MWWSRTIFAAFACLWLAGCGFTPLYGDAAANTEAAVGSNIEIANIPDRDGQFLRNLLIDRLYLKGRPANAPYILSLSPLKAELTSLGIRRDATSTRAMLQASTKLKLVERATNQVVLERDVRAVGGYNQLDNQFATLVSRESVNDHMLEELSDTIVTEVALYFSRNRPATETTP